MTAHTELADTHQTMLRILLDHLIPQDARGRRPSAATIDFAKFSREQAYASQMIHLLKALAQLAQNRFNASFQDLDNEQQSALIADFQRKNRRAFTDFVIRVIQCYCLDASVLGALGHDPRPPFPEGYTVADGDWCLLEPVFERGQCFRPC